MNKINFKNLLRLTGTASALIVISSVMMGGCPQTASSTGSYVRYVNMNTNSKMSISSAQFDTVDFLNLVQFSAYPYETVETTSGPTKVTDIDGNTVYSNSNVDIGGGNQANLIALGNDLNVELANVSLPFDRAKPGGGEVGVVLFMAWNQKSALISMSSIRAMPSRELQSSLE